MKSGCHIYVGQPVLYQRVRRKEEKAMNLKGRNFLKLMDFEPEEILYMIDLAADLKAKKKQGILHDSLSGRLERKRAFRIPQEFWDVCLTESNIVAMDRIS